MPLGDSLTVGGYGDPTGFTDSYRQSLYLSLRNQGADVAFRGHIGAPSNPFGFGAVPPPGVTDEFSHSGVGGFTVDGIRSGVDAWMAEAKPDIVVLNIGTNGGSDASYRALVSQIQRNAPRSVIVLGTLTPVRVEADGSRVIDGFRAEMSTTARALGNASSTDRVIVSEVNGRLLGQQGFPRMTFGDFNDDVHMRTSGGTKFANALLPEVSEAVRLLQSNPCGTH
jgi:lysophospholipase L1-like esterase